MLTIDSYGVNSLRNGSTLICCLSWRAAFSSDFFLHWIPRLLNLQTNSKLLRQAPQICIITISWYWLFIIIGYTWHEHCIIVRLQQFAIHNNLWRREFHLSKGHLRSLIKQTRTVSILNLAQSIQFLSHK